MRKRDTPGAEVHRSEQQQQHRDTLEERIVVRTAHLFRVEEKVAEARGPNVVEKCDKEGLVELEDCRPLAHDLPDAVNPQAKNWRSLVLVREVR